MVTLGLMLLSGSLLLATRLNYDALIHAQIVQMRILSLIRMNELLSFSACDMNCYMNCYLYLLLQ
jgi:hypothetical protein